MRCVNLQGTLFNILQVSFLKEKADFLKKDIPFPTKEKKIKF